MANKGKNEDPSEEVVMKLSDLESLKADILNEAVKSSEAKVKESVKKSFLNDTATAKAKEAYDKEENMTLKFYAALANKDFSTAKAITKESYARAGKALTTTGTATLIPVEEEREILRNIEDYNQLRLDGNVRSISTIDALINEKTGSVSVTVGSEGTAITPSDPTYTHRTPKVLPYKGASKWTLEFQNSMEADVIQDIRTDFVEGFGNAEEDVFLNRTVSGEEGIFQVSGANNYVLGGSTSSGSTTIGSTTVEDVVNAKGALKSLGMSRFNGAKLYLTPSALTAIETNAKANELVHLISYSNGEVTRVGGLEVVELNEDNMPADAVTTDFAFIANLSKVLQIRDLAGMRIEIGESGDDFLAFEKTIRAFKQTAHAVSLPQNIMFLRTSTT